MDILKYVFHEKESYIFDALQFPGMIYYKEEAISKSEENFIEFIPESSKIVLREMYDLILPYTEKAKSWVEEIISKAGKEGYIGIYKDCEKPGCRFLHTKGNGELWTTSRIVMALLAYYEFTDDKKVLDATEKAVKLVMQKYSNKKLLCHRIKRWWCKPWNWLFRKPRMVIPDNRQ